MRKPKDWFNLNTIPVQIKSFCECRLQNPPRAWCFDCCIEKESWSVPDDDQYRPKTDTETRRPAWWYRDQKTRVLTIHDLRFLYPELYPKPVFRRRPRQRNRWRPYASNGFRQT